MNAFNPSSTPPPTVVVQQKKGPGCWGIGCAIVLIVLLLLGGLFAGVSWYLKGKVGALVSSTPTTVRSFDGGDEMYRATQQKLSDFGKAVQESRHATLELSADEINTLIARDAEIKTNHIAIFVTMSGTEGHVEGSVPGSLTPLSFLKDSFLNGSADLSPRFDPSTKSIALHLHALTIGNQPVPQDQLPMMEGQIQPFIDMQIQQSPNTANFLSHVQSLEVSDGKLLIRTQQ